MGDRGYFVEPTVLTDTSPDMKVARGDLRPGRVRDPVRSEHDQVSPRQRHELRPRVGIFTLDIRKAYTTAHRLRAGTVWINCYSVFDAAMPFGGYKQSGWGREMGHNALENYLENKSRSPSSHNTMKAAVVHDYTQPLTIDTSPARAGDDQVLVRIQVCGLCHTDIHAAHGTGRSSRRCR